MSGFYLSVERHVSRCSAVRKGEVGLLSYHSVKFLVISSLGVGKGIDLRC